MSNQAPDQDHEHDQQRNDQPAPKAAAASGRVGPAFAEPEKSIADLSSEIAKALPRSPGQRVTCRRIIGNHYRCNWWSPQTTKDNLRPEMVGLLVTTQRVDKSQFLHVTRTADGLAIKRLGGE